MIEPKMLPKSHSLMKFIREVLGLLGEEREPEIYLVTGRTMRGLNRRFRGKDKATDVLSFEFPEKFPLPKDEERPLGEVYLNPAYIKKNGETLEYLALHGVLHLAGFNHERKSDRIKMEKLETEILEKTGRAKTV